MESGLRIRGFNHELLCCCRELSSCGIMQGRKARLGSLTVNMESRRMDSQGRLTVLQEGGVLLLFLGIEPRRAPGYFTLIGSKAPPAERYSSEVT